MKKKISLFKIYVYGALIIFALLVLLTFIISFISGSSFASYADFETLAIIYITCLIILAALFLFGWIMFKFITKFTPVNQQSVIYKDNTLRYEYIEDGKKKRSTFNIDVIDEYLKKYKTMYIIENLSLEKKNVNKSSNINNLIITEGDMKYTFNELYQNDPDKYIRVCMFLESISDNDIEELYWRMSRYVQSESIRYSSSDLMDSFNKIRQNVSDEQVKEQIDNTMALINNINIKMGEEGFKKDIRRIYEHYLPMLQKICNNYISLEQYGISSDSTSEAKKNLIETFNIINNTLNKLYIELDSGYEDDVTQIYSVDEILNSNKK